MFSNSGHVMTLANSIIGVGILAMPFCFQKCGIILSILLLVLNNFITRISCHYLIKSSLLSRRRSFEFLAFDTFGPPGKLLAELCVIGYLLGTCITYFVVVGDLGPQIVSKVLNMSVDDNLRTLVMFAVTFLFIIPLGMLRNVDSLSTVCTASIGFYICLVLKVIAESKTHIVANDWNDHVLYWRPAGLLQCLPIFSMALSCQMQIFEVFGSITNQSMEKLNGIVKKATLICTVVYIAVGLFGYIAFCTETFSGNILVNFSPTFGSDAIKILFVLSVAFSFPLVIFPCRASIYSLVYRRGHTDASSFIPDTRFKTITVFIVLVALCFALLIPSIELVIGLVGSTIGVAICIMFPAACIRKIIKKESAERTLAQIILIGGLCIMVLGTYANLSAIDEKRSGPTFELQQQPFLNDLRSEVSEAPPKTPNNSTVLSQIISPNNISIKVNISRLKKTKKALTTIKTLVPAPLNAIDKDAIKKDEDIAAEEQKEHSVNKKLKAAENDLKNELQKTVDELKEKLAKQNKETQNLLVETLGQVVEKVEQFEREVHNKEKQVPKESKSIIQNFENGNEVATGNVLKLAANSPTIIQDNLPTKSIANVGYKNGGEIPKASLVGILTENLMNSSQLLLPKENQTMGTNNNETIFESDSHNNNGESFNTMQRAKVGTDNRGPLPLALLINASHIKAPVAVLKKDEKPLENEIEKAIQEQIKHNDSTSKRKVGSEKRDTIGRDILQLNENEDEINTIFPAAQSQSSNQVKEMRKKRDVSEGFHSNLKQKCKAKLYQVDCLSEENEHFKET